MPVPANPPGQLVGLLVLSRWWRQLVGGDVAGEDSEPEQTGPVDGRGQRLDRGAGSPSDETLRISGNRPQGLHESPLPVLGPLPQLGPGAAASFSLPEDPRNEQEVACPGLDYGGTGEQQVAQRVPDLADAQFVAAFWLRELGQQFPNPPLVLLGGVNPGERRNHDCEPPQC